MPQWIEFGLGVYVAFWIAMVGREAWIARRSNNGDADIGKEKDCDDSTNGKVA